MMQKYQKQHFRIPNYDSNLSSSKTAVNLLLLAPRSQDQPYLSKQKPKASEYGLKASTRPSQSTLSSQPRPTASSLDNYHWSPHPPKVFS